MLPVTLPVTLPVKLPVTFDVTLLNETLSPVPTDWPIEISPFDNVTPLPPEKCALVSEALGPV